MKGLSLVAVALMVTSAHAAMTISSAKTKNVSCTGGVCTPTGGNANLNVSELGSRLVSSDVTIISNAAAPDIGILDALTWASSHRLTLDAYESIHVRAPVVVEGTAGVTLITNDGGSGGDYNFSTATLGAITFWDLNSSLVINGQSYTLVGGIATLAGDITANPNGNYALANSYDASGDGTYSAAPIQDFSGRFEGLGNTIQNLKVVAAVADLKIGLFGELAQSAVARDINFSNATVSNTNGHRFYQYVGVLAGYSSGSLFSVNVSGAVSGGRATYAGGVVGYATGLIERSHFSGSIKPNHPKDRDQGFVAGGIAGGLEGGSISYSSATAQISNAGLGGGLVGANLSGNIAWSQAGGSVTGQVAGGLIGGFIIENSISSSITQSFATASVSAIQEGGGLVGLSQGQFGADAIVSQSYATGSVSGGSNAGGFVGKATGSDLTRSYAAGPVSDAQCTGGYAAYFDASDKFGNDYWNTSTTGQSDGSCFVNIRRVRGLTDAQLKTHLPAGFDPTVWGQDANINNGWPYLLANPPQ